MEERRNPSRTEPTAFDRELEAWLAAEQVGADEMAESALSALFAQSPVLPVPEGFAARTAERWQALSAGARQAERRRAPSWLRWLSAAAVLALALGSVAIAATLPGLAEKLGWADFGWAGLMAVLAEMVRSATAGLTETLIWGQRLDGVVAGLAGLVNTPVAAGGATVALALGAFLLRVAAQSVYGPRRQTHARL
ncbi:MAG: hypothetical protein U0002_09630 [Thermoanaerobaculia bacterium]